MLKSDMVQYNVQLSCSFEIKHKFFGITNRKVKKKFNNKIGYSKSKYFLSVKPILIFSSANILQAYLNLKSFNFQQKWIINMYCLVLKST